MIFCSRWERVVARRRVQQQRQQQQPTQVLLTARRCSLCTVQTADGSQGIQQCRAHPHRLLHPRRPSAPRPAEFGLSSIWTERSGQNEIKLRNHHHRHRHSLVYPLPPPLLPSLQGPLAATPTAVLRVTTLAGNVVDLTPLFSPST